MQSPSNLNDRLKNYTEHVDRDIAVENCEDCELAVLRYSRAIPGESFEILSDKEKTMGTIRLFICVLSLVAAATATAAVIKHKNATATYSWNDQEYTDCCC